MDTIKWIENWYRSVCVLYEYSDEFDVDDSEFDVNDITLCQVFVKNNYDGSITRILNDETA